ncbi:MAG: hypothetical protein V9H25_15285 [Candidatus Competibacter sp.]
MVVADGRQRRSGHQGRDPLAGHLERIGHDQRRSGGEEALVVRVEMQLAAGHRGSPRFDSTFNVQPIGIKCSQHFGFWSGLLGIGKYKQKLSR